jgi:hypothetical protein
MEVKMKNASRILCLFLLGGSAVAVGLAHPANTSQTDHSVQVVDNDGADKLRRKEQGNGLE